MDNQKKVCRICYKWIEGEGYEIIEETLSEIIREVLPDIDLTVIRHPVGCNSCITKVQKHFEFKSTCIYTEDFLLPFLQSNKVKKVDLIEVIRQRNNEQKGFELDDDLPSNFVACRLCMNIKKDDYISLDRDSDRYTLEKLLHKYIPEINLNVSEGLVCCSGCLRALKSYDEFQTEYLTNKRKVVIEQQQTVKEERDCQTNQQDTNSETQDSEILEGMDNIDFKDNIFNELTSELTLKVEDIIPKVEEEMEIDSDAEKNPLAVKTGRPKKENREYNCYHCPYSTIHRWNLHLHIDRHNLNKLQFQCDQCPFKAYTRENFKRHQLRMHKVDAKTYNCHICPYQTSHPSLLPRHMIIHRNSHEVEWVKCNLCDYKTKRKDCIRPHMKSVHRGDKRLKCSKCDYRADNRKELYAHQKIHRDLIIPETFECFHCDFKVTNKCYLISHMKLHTQPHITMFKCDYCIFICSTPSGIKRHIKRMHKEINLDD